MGEKERIFQDRRCIELEAEIEARDTRPKGSESIHQGALRIQCETCIQNCEGVADEKVQVDGELRVFGREALYRRSRDRPWWAVSPGHVGVLLLLLMRLFGGVAGVVVAVAIAVDVTVVAV